MVIRLICLSMLNIFWLVKKVSGLNMAIIAIIITSNMNNLDSFCPHTSLKYSCVLFSLTEDFEFANIVLPLRAVDVLVWSRVYTDLRQCKFLVLNLLKFHPDRCRYYPM